MTFDAIKPAGNPIEKMVVYSPLPKAKRRSVVEWFAYNLLRGIINHPNHASFTPILFTGECKEEAFKIARKGVRIAQANMGCYLNFMAIWNDQRDPSTVYVKIPEASRKLVGEEGLYPRYQRCKEALPPPGPEMRELILDPIPSEEEQRRAVNWMVFHLFRKVLKGETSCPLPLVKIPKGAEVDGPAFQIAFKLKHRAVKHLSAGLGYGDIFVRDSAPLYVQLNVRDLNGHYVPDAFYSRPWEKKRLFNLSYLNPPGPRIYHLSTEGEPPLELRQKAVEDGLHMDNIRSKVGTNSKVPLHKGFKKRLLAVFKCFPKLRSLLNLSLHLFF